VELFFRSLLHELQGSTAFDVGDGEKEHVQEENGRGVRSAEGLRVDWGQEELVRKTCDGRYVGVRDSNAICALLARLLNTFDGHAKAATKTDGDHNIAFANPAGSMDGSSG